MYSELESGYGRRKKINIYFANKQKRRETEIQKDV